MVATLFVFSFDRGEFRKRVSALSTRQIFLEAIQEIHLVYILCWVFYFTFRFDREARVVKDLSEVKRSYVVIDRDYYGWTQVYTQYWFHSFNPTLTFMCLWLR